MTISLLILFLLLSALFSGTEIAFVSSSKLHIELKKTKGGRRGRILSKFFEEPANFLSTMLVGNNIALVLFSEAAEGLLSEFIEINEEFEVLRLLIYTLITTIVVLIFGEFLPKTLFRLFADRILYALVYPLQLLRILLFLPSWLIMQLSNLIIRLITKKNPAEEVEKVFTRYDLEHFVRNTTQDEKDEIDTDMFEKALHLREVKLKDCLIPRMEVEYIDVSQSIEELRDKIISTKLSRIIVTQDQDIDNILGYVHHQKLLEEPINIADIIMDMSFVPETMPAQEMLNQFIKKQDSIACVVDEFGGTAGIVALEDILEELVGEIEDEHDSGDDHVEEAISEREFRLSGRLEIDYLNDKYELLNFPDGNFHTLSGYIVMTRGTIPEQGEDFFMGGHHFHLESVSNTRIEVVRVKVLAEEAN